MTRLIDADELRELYFERSNFDTYNDYNFAIDTLDDMPTVDAVPVVRCKECKHYYALNEVRGNCSEYNFVEKIPIDYCSWAERKDNGTD